MSRTWHATNLIGAARAPGLHVLSAPPFAQLETEPVRLGFANQSIKTICLNHLDDQGKSLEGCSAYADWLGKAFNNLAD